MISIKLKFKSYVLITKESDYINVLGFVKNGTVHEYTVNYPAPPADD